MYLRLQIDERPLAFIRHWLFWHQPRRRRHRAFAGAAARLRHDLWLCGIRRWSARIDRATKPFPIRGPLTIAHFSYLNTSPAGDECSVATPS